jgi:hypothetical protein
MKYAEIIVQISALGKNLQTIEISGLIDQSNQYVTENEVTRWRLALERSCAIIVLFERNLVLRGAENS